MLRVLLLTIMLGGNIKAHYLMLSEYSNMPATSTRLRCQDIQYIRYFTSADERFTLPSSEFRSVAPLKVVALELWEDKLLLTVMSRSASGVVTVLASPSTAAFNSYNLRIISSCRASRALTAGSTSPFCGNRDNR